MTRSTSVPIVAITRITLKRIASDFLLRAICLQNRSGLSLEETVSCFADNPENILAWLGPAIGPRAFEVGAEVREAFMAVDAKASTAFIQHGDKYLADIYLLARQRLASVGVEQIFGGGRCTYTENETFFSYRRDKTTGRMASFIWLI